MKEIAIVGANSYIARNLIYCLKKTIECNLYLYDCSESHLDGESGYTQINVLDLNSIKQINMNCDIIYMFVGKTGTLNGFDEYQTFIDVNEKSLLNLLTEYKRQRSKAKIVFPSTRLVYKGSNNLLVETSEKEFKTIYALTKWSCENYLKQFNQLFGVDYVIFRICVPYGSLIDDATSYGTVDFMLKKAKNGENITLYGTGTVRRTITYIGDLCKILIEGALSEKCKNDIFNIGGEDYSLKEMAELIGKKYNVGVEFVEYPKLSKLIESGSTVFDASKLERLLNIKYSRFSEWGLRNIHN